MQIVSLNDLNMILRPLRLLPLGRGTAVVFLLTIILRNVNGRPQDPGTFQQVSSQILAIAGDMAEMVKNAGMIKSDAGTGAADDSSEEDRRKRSIDQIGENTLIGEELLRLLPLDHQHHDVHRGKRAPCHSYGGGTGGGGTGGGTGGDGTGDEDIDLERRRRAYAARKRKAAAERAKNKKTTTGSRKKKLIGVDDTEDSVAPVSARRKRQSEVDDLNQAMQNGGKDFAQVVEKIRRAFDSFAASMNEMAQRLKQHFSDRNDMNAMEI